MLETREISYATEDYRKALDLRNRILRLPLGRSLLQEDLSREGQCWHIGCFSGDTLAGVLMLVPLPENRVQMRQVATDERFREQGCGWAAVEFAEKFLIQKGIREIIVHARRTASGFYQRLGYDIVGEPFVEMELPHLEMRKILI